MTVSKYYTRSEIETAVSGKADKSGLGTMALVNDAPSDGKTYGRKNGSWAEASGGGGGSAAWGSISGTLSDQTDLQNALNAKADSSSLSSYAPLASPALTGNPTAPTQTAGDNSTKIATTAYVDSGLSGKSDTGHTHDDRYYTESEIDGKFGKEIQYYSAQTVSVASGAQIMRIPASGTSEAITTDTVVLNCTFANPANIASNVTWTSYAGYITFSGTCTTATTANVTLGQKGN